MANFSDIGKNISSASKDVAEKAKGIASQTKLKREISDGELEMKRIFQEIGKKYYEEKDTFRAEKFVELCEKCDGISKKVVLCKSQLNAMKGIKVCENCGAEIRNEFKFCGVCGTKLPAPPPKDDAVEKIIAEIVDEKEE
ncbi:MAG: zinc ribbon domain-containing protein [Oscillospiraceae bacterium]